MYKEKTEQMIRATDRIERNTLKDLRNQYSLSLKSVRKDLADSYIKYSKDGILTYSEMQKFNRLSRLEKSIIDELNLLYKGSGKEINNTLGDIYQQSFLRNGFALETETQTKLAFAKIPKEQIVSAVQNPISGIVLNERLINNRKQLIIKTREAITQGLIQGESLNKVAKRLKDVYEGDFNKTIRIVRTETNRVRNEGTLKAYEKAEQKGIEIKKVWLATLDDRTRDTHRQLDGQAADENGLFHVRGNSTTAPGQFGIASEDINCRCTTIARIKAPSVRRTREKVIPYTTYNSWLENRVS